MQFISEDIENYAINHSSSLSEDCQKIYNYTLEHESMSRMLIGPLEASFLKFLIKSSARKFVLEIGTFTGFSALNMAEALEDDGCVLTLDNNQKSLDIAKGFWDRSSHGHKISSICDDALNVIKKLRPEEIRFDFVFIDADKENYMQYLVHVEPLLTKDAIIVVDNVLWSGRVLDKEQVLKDTTTRSIYEFNEYIKKNSHKYQTSFLPIRDGVYLIKRID